MLTLKQGSRGELVKRLQQRLSEEGFDLGTIDGDFGAKTSAALAQFQASKGLVSDGIAGRRTLGALGLDLNESAQAAQQTSSQPSPTKNTTDDDDPLFPVQLVQNICHDSSKQNIAHHWPLIVDALKAVDLYNREMALMAIATIYVETGRFCPLNEYISIYNTTATGHDFDKYDDRSDLGNTGYPDGSRYKGRGYIQLTGRDNYRKIGEKIGLADKLEQDPELANDPEVAAQVLAAFLKRSELKIKTALSDLDLRKARRVVNGGSHGLPEFERCYRLGLRLTHASTE